MSRKNTYLDDFAKLLRRDEEILHDLMNLVINEIKDTSFSRKEREVASRISQSAGDYLESWALLNFISEKYSQDEVFELIETRKRLVSRLALLLPSIIELLNLTDIRDIASATHQIYDCAGDYPAIEKSQYSSQQRKKIVQGINSIIELAERLDDALDQAGSHVDIEFHHHKDAIARIRGNEPERGRIEELRRELMTLRFVSRMTLYRDDIGEQSFFVGDNKARTHIVEYAYRLALQFGTPVLKTTPGSDFSTLCSLIFEVATGTASESLAGAINKFARSSERREIDEEEIIHRYENSDEGIAEYEADNFSGVKASIKSCEVEEVFWQKMMSSQQWDDDSRHHISMRLLDARERKQSAMKEHGPFIVWASQMSRVTLDEWQEEAERRESEILALAVELGQKIRNRSD